VTLPWVAFAVIRIVGLEDGFLVEALAFTPYVAASAIGPVLVAVLLRVWPAAVLAAVVCAALLVAVVPRGFGGPTEPVGGEGPTLRVLAANMEFGRGAPETLVELAADLDVDALGIEELTPFLAHSLEERGLSELLPHGVVHAKEGPGGIGLYARFPTGPSRRIQLPGGFPMIEAPVELPGAPAIALAAVHTNPPTASRWEEDLNALPAAEDDPLRIMFGDFNATLDHAAFRDLLGRGYEDAAATLGDGLTPTWPVGRDTLPALFAIDHVLADERVGIRDFSVHEIAGTDHKAVYAELVLPAG